MDGSSANLSAIAQVTSSQTLEFKYQRRRTDEVGFPDFQSPFFFQEITLPWSRLDKMSATYSVTNLASWFPRLTVTPYYQRQDRLLRNRLPAQFPAPTAVTFFPINVFRLNIESDTRQQVWTPGVDVQATFQLARSQSPHRRRDRRIATAVRTSARARRPRRRSARWRSAREVRPRRSIRRPSCSVRRR